VRSIVLRGAGRALTGGYDLYPDDGSEMAGGWGSPFDAPGPKPRAGAWDPVRDLQFMGNNVRRFMQIWECPKPVLGQIHGWAIGGATDLILCCDLLFMADEAYIGYSPSRIFGTPTTMMWVYRLGLEHAKQFLLSGDAIDAETAHRIGLVSQICPADEIEDHLAPYRVGGIDGDPELPRVEVREWNTCLETRDTVFEGRCGARGLEAIVGLDLDHRGAVVGEDAGCGRSGERPHEVHDLEVRQRSGRHHTTPALRKR